MKNPLSSYSQNPDVLLARSISQIALSLKHPNVNTLRKRILDVLQLRGQSPLSAQELDIILDCLTSQQWDNALILINHRLFCDFDYEKMLRERHFLDKTLWELSRFEQGGQYRHTELRKTGETLSDFAQSEKGKEPDQITIQWIANYVELRQAQAVNAQNRKLFAEACQWGETEVLYTCQNTKIPTGLHYDPEHKLIGWWNEAGKIIDRTVLSGLHPVAPAFFGDEITVHCADENGQLHLVEYNPNGLYYFGYMPINSISVIPSKNIGDRHVIPNRDSLKPEIFYCYVNNYWSPKIIHSGPGRTITSNEPIREFKIDGDVIFVTHESSGSCASYKVHSLQTGAWVDIENKNIEKQEETPDDIIFTLRHRDAFDGTIHLPEKQPAKWQLGKKWWAKKTVSLKEFAELWKETAKEAQDRKI